MTSKCDVAIDAYHSEVLAEIIVRNLGTKGFCTIDARLTQEQLNNARADCLDADNAGRFFPTSHLIADGLLGAAGSARIAHLQRPDDKNSPPDGEHLVLLDSLMSELGECVGLETSKLGFGTSARTPGLLHEAGQNQGKGATDYITEIEASEWMVQFLRAKIMCFVLLGPASARLKMQPFSNKENLEIEINPGEVMLLRADLLSHALFASDKTHVLSCFFLGDQSLANKRNYAKDEDLNLIPGARNLYSWIESRLAECKGMEDDDAEMPDLPSSWLKAMNACYFTSQRTCVQGSYLRCPAVWGSKVWSDTHNCGTDYALEVPMTRWIVDEHYDPDPDAWKMLKSYNRHIGYVDGLDLFECKFFNLSPAESKGMDPQQRWMLEGGYTALHLSGYDKKRLMNSFGSVVVAVDNINEWASCPKDEDSGATGGSVAITSNRFSFCLGMKGPSYTVHAEQAASFLAMHSACQSIGTRGRYVVPPYAMVAGSSMCLWYGKLCTIQATGVLSNKGRCLSFNDTADGYVRSDGAAWGVICPQATVADGEAFVKEVPPEGGTICGSDICQNGNIRFGSVCGPALLEVIDHAMRAACLQPCEMDAVECNARGVHFADAIEAKALKKALNPVDTVDTSSTHCLTALNSGQGNQLEGSGMCKIINAMLRIKAGSVSPTIALHTLNPYIFDDRNDEEANNIAFPTESVEFKARSALFGIMGYGSGGTNVFLSMVGDMNDAATASSRSTSPYKEIVFWPAGGGKLEASSIPRRGYHIVGTMTNWESQIMISRGGSNIYTMTLGENRWDAFQIWLDGDEKRCLYPGSALGSVEGPDEVDRSSVWKLDGRPGYAWTEDGELTEIATPHSGIIGTRYNIILRVAGKYRTVEWEKITQTEQELQSLTGSALKGSEAEYFLYSPSTDTIEQMKKDDEQAVGQFSCTLRLPRDLPLSGVDGSGRLERVFEFQILRNKDWSQVIYPADERAGQESRVCGPDSYDECRFLSWGLRGPKYSCFRIYFRRTSEHGRDSMSVWWEEVEQG